MFLVKPERRRLLQVGATVAVIALGLASRAYPQFLPAALGKYPGDALWAMMIVFALGAIATRMRTWQLALTSLLICFAVEFGQLYQAPWIVALRAHPLGHLVLGSTFGWADLIAYTAGVAVAAFIDKLALFKRR
jgi:4-hydroxybenzoate polyprenyltransferase